jgi:hypothetical protein
MTCLGRSGRGCAIGRVTPHDVITLTHQPIDRVTDRTAVLLAYVYFYDQRSSGVETACKSGVETACKEDKQGLGLTKRSKKRFAVPHMVLALSTLAHNVLVWMRTGLAARVPALARYGLLRLVRDILHVSGLVVFDPATGRVCRLVLHAAALLVGGLVAALRLLLAPVQVAVTLGETYCLSEYRQKGPCAGLRATLRGFRISC